jgi:hypothetical protein
MVPCSRFNSREDEGFTTFDVVNGLRDLTMAAKVLADIVAERVEV